MSAETDTSGSITNGLVIGAMKCGTTTLYHDLKRVPGLSVPAKELSFFQRRPSEVNGESYSKIFADHEANVPSMVQCRLDISTTYSMWPDVDQVPERAAELLNGSARIVYLVRDPIDRAVSHHHHMMARGATTAGFAQYLQDDPGVVGYSRYDLQAKRWTDLFGQGSLLVIRLDDYASDWPAVAPRILSHLGVDYDLAQLGEPGRENVTDQAKVFTGRSRQIAESSLFNLVYRNGVRRLLSDSARTKLRNAILPAPPERPVGPDRDVLLSLVKELQPAAEFVAEVTGTPRWDLARTADLLAAGS